MAQTSGKTLAAFLNAQSAPDGLKGLIAGIAEGCVRISHAVRQGATADMLGVAGDTNVQGEVQKTLDLAADDIMMDVCRAAPGVVAVASEEQDDIVTVAQVGPNEGWLVLFDPLDGSSNIEVNVSIGTIFSVLPAPSAETPRDPAAEDFFQPGRNQAAAGYVVYGPQTLLVFTLGDGAFGFTLEPDSGEWVLTHDRIAVPAETKEFAINASNQRHWHEPVQRYIADCLAGTTGPRGKDFNMRWVASMVADVNRIMMRGGVFLYPADRKDPSKPGRLRLMYEAAPMAMVMEQAGGAASDGTQAMLDVVPAALHQRVPVMIGSKAEVETFLTYV
ncbi:MAG: fructose-1,6-bisphosphatase I [Brevundimonas sp.]|jgi:fructose-1,6-bisphosphatase I|uniref:class 1 fructose-bisphosphatase n=1 Tax=Brevundimonas sp. TaxID=1871086 RepID=UPI0039E4BBE9